MIKQWLPSIPPLWCNFPPVYVMPNILPDCYETVLAAVRPMRNLPKELNVYWLRRVHKMQSGYFRFPAMTALHIQQMIYL